MNFVIDIGNSNIVLGIYNRDSLVCKWRLQTSNASAASVDVIHESIKKGFAQNNYEFSQIKNIAVSSVVPALSKIFKLFLDRNFTCSSNFIDAYTDLGLSFPMTDPGFIGSDLVVSSYAVWKKYQTNCLICDFGTATTFHLVDVNGFFHGSIIAPGLNISAQALFSVAAQLEEIELKKPEVLLGTNTHDSMLSGIITGHQMSIEGLITKVKDEYKQLGEIKTIATGGIASFICSESNLIDRIEADLILDGLNLICREIGN